MKIKYKKGWAVFGVVFLLSIICAPNIHGQKNQNRSLTDLYGNANNLIRLVLEKAKINETVRTKHYKYNAEHIVRRTDDKGGLLLSGQEQPDEIKEMLVLYGENGVRKIQVLKRNGQKQENPENIGFHYDLNNILASRYEYTFTSNQPVQISGAYYIVVDFKPRKYLSFDTKEDHVINRAEGKIFVKADNLMVWKLEGRLPSEFTLGALWFKIYSANIVFEQHDVEGVFFEKVVTVAARYRNGWFASPKNLDEVFTFSNYSRIH